MNRRTPARLWSRIVPPTRPGRQRSRWGTRSLLIYRLVLAASIVGLLTYLSPSQRPYNIGELRVDSVAQERVIAPFLFYVRKSDDEFAREQTEAEKAVPNILRHRPEVKVIELTRLDSAFKVMFPNIRMQMADSLKHRRLQRALPKVIGSLSESAREELIRAFAEAPPEYIASFQEASRLLLADLYAAGILPEKQAIRTALTSKVRLDGIDLDLASINSAVALRQRGDLLPLLSSYGPLVELVSAEAVYELLNQFIKPNLEIDQVQTNRLRQTERTSVARIKDQYVKDELIIDKNTRVAPKHIEALNALAAEIAVRESADLSKRLQKALAAGIIVLFTVLAFGFYLSILAKDTFAHPAHLLLLSLLFTFLAVSTFYFKANDIHAYFIPIPLVSMLATILFTPQTGLVFSLLSAIFVGGMYGDFNMALVGGLTSAVAVYSVRHVRHRNQFYRAMLSLPLSYSLLIAATETLRFVPLEELPQMILPGLITGIAAPILTIGLLPIFESVFKITTDITLLELSDQNRPLLRNLAMRAPGTYTHSLNMANLSEVAAEAINANPLLARVGCYYHDIGKMLKPEYFSENQGMFGGRNPHDHLTPTMSMLIIAAHVKDGLELAEEYGLPQALCDLIPQHHGTTVIEYFYNRAVELGVANVRRDDFCYDGPKPQTKEAGILMLADSVESAARTLTERTPSRVRQLVRRIIQQKFTEGELDECHLTLQDLNKIEGSFIPVLMGTFHERVEYPWQKAEKKAQRKLGNSSHGKNG
jgi:cyclic-di-AMP phosphodiesterase PgpH